MSQKPVGLTPAGMVRHYIQTMLDNSGEGWQLAQYVLCMGLERVDSEGQLECTPWLWAPHDQADWMTDGLLQACVGLREEADVVDDD